MELITTERLSVRTLSVADAGFILELLNEPGFLHYIGDRGVHTLNQARAYILNGPVTSYQRFGFGLWLVTLKASGEPLGLCGLIKREVLEDVDLGYAFLEQYWGQGYASEVTTAVAAYACATLGLKTIVAVVNPENRKSIRVLEKLGMRYEKMVRLSAAAPEIKLFRLDF